MELVNRNYIKVTNPDLFVILLSAMESSNTKRCLYFDRLIRTKLDLALSLRKHIDEVYIDINEPSFKELGFDMMEIPISGESFSKARDKALEKGGDLEIVRKMQQIPFAPTGIPRKLEKEVLDYILDNSENVIKYGYFYDGSTLKYRNLDEQQKGIEDKRKSFTNKPIQG